jgi:hypothetical protein
VIAIAKRETVHHREMIYDSVRISRNSRSVGDRDSAAAEIKKKEKKDRPFVPRRSARSVISSRRCGDEN